MLRKKGFTLIEVLVVVIIALLVTVMAVPAYKKSQQNNKYLAASGALINLGNAVRMLLEDYPNVDSMSVNLTSNQQWSAGGNQDLSVAPASGSNLLQWLVQQGYLTEFPVPYKGYTFALSTTGAATCGSCSGTGALACMYSSTDNVCAWVDKTGILHRS